jgi:hypothetical protein
MKRRASGTATPSYTKLRLRRRLRRPRGSTVSVDPRQLRELK